jgi:hypothetical protein
VIYFSISKKKKYFKVVGISSQTIKWSEKKIFNRIRCQLLSPLVFEDEKIKIKEN